MSGRAENGTKVKKKIQIENMFMPTIVEEYTETLFASKEPRTVERYTRAVQDLIKFCAKKKGVRSSVYDIKNITESEVVQYMNQYRYKKNSDGSVKELKPTAIQTQWSCLNSFFTYLVRRRIRTDNPMSLIDRPSGKSEATKVDISAEDLRKFLATIKTGVRLSKMGTHVNISKEWISRDYCLFLLMVTTGMRKEALVEIDIEDFDPQTNCLHVTDKRHKILNYELSDSVVEVIKEWIRNRENICAQEKVRGKAIKTWPRLSGPLFISTTGNRLNVDRVDDLLTSYFCQISDKHISPHKLRAAFCTLYYEKTKDIYAVQRAVGHSSPHITQRYIVDKENQQKKATEYMSNLFD